MTKRIDNMEDIKTGQYEDIECGVHEDIEYGVHGDIEYGVHGDIKYGVHGDIDYGLLEGMTLAERLDWMSVRYCMNRAEMARKAGIKPLTMNCWVTRGRMSGAGGMALSVAFPEINRSWLTTGHFDGKVVRPAGARRVEALGVSAETVDKCVESGSALFVKDFAVTCGDTELSQQSEEMIRIALPHKGIKYVFPCKGESMEPRICDGDYVGVGEQMGRYDRFRKDEMYLIITKSGKAMVKMVEDPGQDVPYLQLSTCNEGYRLEDEGRLPKEDVRTAYRVGMVMNFI